MIIQSPTATGQQDEKSCQHACLARTDGQEKRCAQGGANPQPASTRQMITEQPVAKARSGHEL